MKEQLIEEIKELMKSDSSQTTEINPNYLEYFEVEELIDIRDKLILKKSCISETTNNYLDEIYEKTKKDEL